MKKTSPGPDRQREHGVALIVTISMLVLLTVAAVAFFSRATANRSVENSRANKLLADQLAASGVDHAAGLILGEIAAGSTATTNSGFVVYRPNMNSNAVPQRVLATGVGANDTNFANLVRQTTGGAHNTAAPAQNGRAVGLTRWNAPFLLGGSGFTATDQLPSWVYVNRDGTTTGTPTTTAIGRFAVNVYDVGGLLDANVAGFPSGIAAGSPDRGILKGSVAGADLGLIPGVTDANAFVRWRNTNTASSAAGYVTAVTDAAARGFLRPAPGDHRLQSRQDLITAARNGTGGLTTEALPYLTTFSRAVNAPSWYPTLNASQMANYAATKETPGSRRNYANEANDAAAPNRFLPNVRVTGNFTRADGTTARPGEPLVKHRFPLSRLAGVGSNGVNAAGNTTMVGGALAPATAATVQRDFGLVWDAGSRSWTYAGPGGTAAQSGIRTLAEVAAENREPNFFELLKAGILNGSLGKTTALDTGVANVAPDLNLDLQILKIGANLIDQADADDAPTSISPLAGRDDTELVLGIENHPYIYMMSQTHFRRRDKDYNPADEWNKQPWVTGYQQMQVWNPHLNAGSTGRTYRIRALQGATLLRAGRTRPASMAGPIIGTEEVDQTGRFISFPGNQSFAEPVLLTPDNISDYSPQHRPPNTSIVGFHLGDLKADNNLDGDKNNGNDYNGLFVSPQVPVPVYQLEYLDGGSWVPVQRLYPQRGTCGNGMADSLQAVTDQIYGNNPAVNRNMGLIWVKTDPRCQRFGFYGTSAVGLLNNRTMRPQATGSGQSAWEQASGGAAYRDANMNPGWKVVYPLPVSGGQNNVGYTPDDFSDNRPTSPSRVHDADGVLRPADGTRTTNIPGPGSQARPVMLNRPFRSVGEMGYALRDDPWKTLDFASANSADAALLDVFSVAESPVGGVTAGALDLNTRQQPVLQAVLAGALKNEVNPSSTLTASEVGDIADKIIGATAATPLLNRAELVTRIVSADAPGLASADDKDIKTRRESVVRALADAGQTRTWNLMCDVVAQSGRFPGTATGAGDFVVEGEARCWVHLAIDRYNGQIVARQMEFVNE